MKESKGEQVNSDDSAGVPAVAGAQSVMSSKPSIPHLVLTVSRFRRLAFLGL